LLLKLELMLSNGDSSGRVVRRKGLTMGGFFKVLLGGALGAVLGIMFMRKQGAVKPGQGPEIPAARPEPAPPLTAPVAPVAAPVAPAAAPVAAAPVAPAVAAPPAPEPVVARPAPEPVVVPPAPQPVVEAPPVWEPAVAIAPEPVAIPAPPPAPTPVPAPVPVAPAVVPAAAAAAVVTADVAAPAQAPPVPAPPAPEPAESHPAAWAAGGAAVAGLAHAVSREQAQEEVREPVREATPSGAAGIAVAGVAAAQAVEAPPIAAAEPEVAAVQPVFAEAVHADQPAPPVEAAPAAPIYMDRVPSFVEAEATAAILATPEVPTFEETTIPANASEVLLTPEVLEEPLPGAGWEPSAVFVQEEVELEELLPVVSDDVQPYEAPLAMPGGGADEAWDTAGWPESAPAVAGAAALEEEPVPEWGFVAQAAAAEVEAAPVRPEPVAAFAPEVESELIAEPAASEPSLGAAELTPEAALGEDLKSRIEETRRRIREELEKPFAAVDEETPAATPPPVAPAAAAAAASVIGEPMQVTVQPPGNGAPALASEAEVSDEDGSDYDAMRARIELTRSRLKAKAFDAMMAGESSLLGRDVDGSSSPARPTASFDSEIEQTVDSTLREDDQ
jgi:hypothetical protein